MASTETVLDEMKGQHGVCVCVYECVFSISLLLPFESRLPGRKGGIRKDLALKAQEGREV